jgi:hypothetical protein
MSRLLAPLIATTVILTSGLAQGVWTGRWSNSRELETRVANLERVPMVIGDWEGRASTLDKRTLEVAEIAGYVARQYKNRRDGRVVTILLVCGRPGPISVHTPEVCYAGNGFEPRGPAVRRSFGDNALGPNEFWVLDLDKHVSVLSEALRINYSWSVGANWVASDRPRLDFAGSRALYKLYVIHAIVGEAEADREGIDSDFEQELLPVLRTALFPE